MSEYKVTTKKEFMKNAELVYKLLKKHPEMSMHIEARHLSRKVSVKYWAYSYRHQDGRYMHPGGDLNVFVLNLSQGRILNP